MPRAIEYSDVGIGGLGLEPVFSRYVALTFASLGSISSSVRWISTCNLQCLHMNGTPKIVISIMSGANRHWRSIKHSDVFKSK